MAARRFRCDHITGDVAAAFADVEDGSPARSALLSLEAGRGATHFNFHLNPSV